ncbi:MAG TPA: hypothetical protein V6D33_08970 [Cyanophyceae cyanobacterium]
MLTQRAKIAKITPETEALMLLAGGSLATDLVFFLTPNSIILSLIVGAGLTMGMYPRSTTRFVNGFNWIYRHCQWAGVIFSGALILYLLNFFASPAQAQFLNQTESWMTSVFPQAQAFAPLIFNAIRLLIVLFVIFKGYQAVQAARNDEEWSSLVKIPLMILVLVAVTDITVGFITGAGGNP